MSLTQTVPTNGTSAQATVNNFLALTKPFAKLWNTNNSKGGEHLSANPNWSDGMLQAYIDLFELCGVEGFVYNGYRYIHETSKNGSDYIRREPFVDIIDKAKVDDVRARLKASWDARAAYRMSKGNNGSVVASDDDIV